MNLSWRDRPEKAEAREHIFREVGPRYATLFMPAAECLCIQAAIKAGVIKPTTKIIAVERDRNIIPAMTRNLKALRIKATIFPDELYRLRLDKPLDFAFLDFNGSLNQSMAEWFEYLSGYLSEGAVLTVTLALAWRNNQFLPRCFDDLIEQAPDFVEQLADELSCSNYDIILMVALFGIIFHKWSFKTDFQLRYRDVGSVPMTAYRFYDFRKQRSKVPYRLQAGQIRRIK